MPPSGERITVGLVRGFQGLRGAVRIEVLSDEPARFDPGRVLFAEGSEEPLTVAWAQPSKPGLLLRFTERPTRESVEALRDRYLEAIPEESLPAGTWYWHQIIGLEVRTTSGDVLGTVHDVFRAGEGEVYVVRGGAHGEVLVPAVKSVVTELAPGKGGITVDAVALALPDEPPPRRRRRDRPAPTAGEVGRDDGGGRRDDEGSGAP